jgi:hypothetical protein
VIAHLLCAKDLDQALSLLDEKLAQSTQLAPMRMIGADPLATIVALRAWVLAATDQPDLARKEATDAEGRINSDLVHHRAPRNPHPRRSPVHRSPHPADPRHTSPPQNPHFGAKFGHETT